jgi:1,4-dihydroxy-2-naphthoate octaprenyltransferase
MTSSRPTPTVKTWIQGARPRTLGAAIAPVAVGTAVALDDGSISWPRAAAALIVALALQVATNFANDLADGRRGLDGPDRVGPVRLVGSGLASEGAVKRAMLLSFAVALVAGGALVLVVGPELLIVGVLSVAAGWGYTGGKNPYGYRAMGELSVFLFFGLVATAGSTYVQTERIAPQALLLGSAIGLVSAALLVVNNLRDRAADERQGKRTLAVRLGERGTRTLFSASLISAGLLVVLTAAVWGWPILAGLIVTPLGIDAVRRVRTGAEGPALIEVLGITGQILLIGGVALAVGVALAERGPLAV